MLFFSIYRAAFCHFLASVFFDVQNSDCQSAGAGNFSASKVPTVDQCHKFPLSIGKCREF